MPALPDGAPGADRCRPGVQDGRRLRGRPERLRRHDGRRRQRLHEERHDHPPAPARARRARRDSMYGASVFPNMFLDMTGTVAIATRLQPRGPALTTIVTEYLFRPEVIAEPGFDPSEVVEFSELVAHQDYVVCERAQKGVSSRAFTAASSPRKTPCLRVRPGVPARATTPSRRRRWWRGRARPAGCERRRPRRAGSGSPSRVMPS